MFWKEKVFLVILVSICPLSCSDSIVSCVLLLYRAERLINNNPLIFYVNYSKYCPPVFAHPELFFSLIMSSLLILLLASIFSFLSFFSQICIFYTHNTILLVLWDSIIGHYMLLLLIFSRISTFLPPSFRAEEIYVSSFLNPPASFFVSASFFTCSDAWMYLYLFLCTFLTTKDPFLLFFILESLFLMSSFCL